jgi:hypothetical protein
MSKDIETVEYWQLSFYDTLINTKFDNAEVVYSDTYVDTGIAIVSGDQRINVDADWGWDGVDALSVELCGADNAAVTYSYTNDPISAANDIAEKIKNLI